MEGTYVVDLLIIMLERVGTIIAVAFLLTRFQFFKKMFQSISLDRRQQWTAILFFGFFGVIGTYLGVSLHTNSLQYSNVTVGLMEEEAIANMRVIGIVIAGLLGGYRVGVGAGLIAGIHRITLGGFTAWSCGISTIIAGIMASAFYRKGKNIHPTYAFILCAVAEAVQMGAILVFSKPFENAYALVQVIGMPMILANGVGAALFMLIVRNVMAEEEKAVAEQAQKILRIAEETLSYLRKGMTEKTAQAVSLILYRELRPEAVAITDGQQILAHIGKGEDHHKHGMAIQTQVTREVMKVGKVLAVKEEELNCPIAGCQLGAVIIAPLTQREQVVGTLKLYYSSDKMLTERTVELVTGLSSLLSHQLDIAETDHAYQLAKEAEIKALQAQINPHFLFNTLNIIMSLIRTNPEQARQLISTLSFFLRQNVTGTTADEITLLQELEQVKAYLAITEARFIDRLTIYYEVDERLLREKIPPFILQPLIENAIHHGIKDKETDCKITVSIQQIAEGKVEIAVADNGVGISMERLQDIGTDQVSSESGTGMGLYNVNRRLTMTFGQQSALSIASRKGEGTRVSFQLDHLGRGVV